MDAAAIQPYHPSELRITSGEQPQGSTSVPMSVFRLGETPNRTDLAPLSEPELRIYKRLYAVLQDPAVQQLPKTDRLAAVAFALRGIHKLPAVRGVDMPKAEITKHFAEAVVLTGQEKSAAASANYIMHGLVDRSSPIGKISNRFIRIESLRNNSDLFPGTLAEHRRKPSSVALSLGITEDDARAIVDLPAGEALTKVWWSLLPHEESSRANQPEFPKFKSEQELHQMRQAYRDRQIEQQIERRRSQAILAAGNKKTRLGRVINAIWPFSNQEP